MPVLYPPVGGGESPSGDVTAAGGTWTVAAIKGATVGTAGGALTTGKVLRVTGASSVDYGAVDLANASAVTGLLPKGNQGAQDMTGDVTGTTAASVVSAIAGVSPLPVSSAVLQWAAGVASPAIKQADLTTNSGTGQNAVFQAQNATGTTATGGNAGFQAGTGTAAQGFVFFGTSAGDAVRFTPAPTGASTWSVQSGVTAFTLGQAATAAANGAAWNISAQASSLDGGSGGSTTVSAGNSTGATTGTGGSLNLSAGSGTTTNGSVRLQAGGSTAVTLAVNPTGTHGYTVAAGCTAWNVTQSSTSSANGATLAVTAQATTRTDTNGTGGAVTITGGGATGANSATNTGGGLTLRAGGASGGTTNNGGTLNLSSGSGTTATGNITFQAGGSTAITLTPNAAGSNTFQFASGVTAVAFSQATASAASGANWSITGQPSSFATGTVNGGNVTISGGAASGAATTNSGGSVVLNGANATAAGTNNLGTVQIQQNAVELVRFGGAGIQKASTSVAVTTGTVTLTAVQYRFPTIVLTGTLSGNVTVVFPSTAGGEWVVDATAVVLGGHTITAQANSVNLGTTIDATNMFRLVYGGAGKLYGSTLAA